MQTCNGDSPAPKPSLAPYYPKTKARGPSQPAPPPAQPPSLPAAGVGVGVGGGKHEFPEPPVRSASVDPLLSADPASDLLILSSTVTLLSLSVYIFHFQNFEFGSLSPCSFSIRCYSCLINSTLFLELWK